MFYDSQIPLPFLFNPLKHHLGFIKNYISGTFISGISNDSHTVIKDLKHMGVSLMDIYTGSIAMEAVFEEIIKFLNNGNLSRMGAFGTWAGKHSKDFGMGFKVF